MLCFRLFKSHTKLSWIVSLVYVRMIKTYGKRLVPSYVFTWVSDIILIERSDNLIKQDIPLDCKIEPLLHNTDLHVQINLIELHNW